MAGDWYESMPRRRWQIGIAGVAAILLAVHLITGYQMVTHEPPPTPVVIEPSEELATTVITASGWTLTIDPDGDAFTAIATRGKDRLIAHGLTRDIAAVELARKVAGP